MALPVYCCAVLQHKPEPNSNLDMLGRDVSNASILPKLRNTEWSRAWESTPISSVASSRLLCSTWHRIVICLLTLMSNYYKNHLCALLKKGICMNFAVDFKNLAQLLAFNLCDQRFPWKLPQMVFFFRFFLPQWECMWNAEEGLPWQNKPIRETISSRKRFNSLKGVF